MSQVTYNTGNRVRVFYAKKREWVSGTVQDVNKTGATVLLDTGFTGFFYWASMSPAVERKPNTPTQREAPPSLPPLQQEFFRATGDEPGVTVRLVLLTPELAEELLARNEMNRPVNVANLKRIKAALMDGSWKFNGDTVCMSRSGRVIDGQHRCRGVVDTGRSIWVILVEGLDEDVFATKDIGARRRASDVLAILGETNCKALAAALVWVDRYVNGRMDQVFASVSTFSIEDFLSEHRRLADSAREFGGKNNGLIPPSLVAALHYLFSCVNQEDADRFFRDLISGIGLAEDDGVYLLRERLVKNRTMKAKLPNFQIAALAIKAWNARRRGQPVRALRWRSEGDTGEPFPAIAGLSLAG